jgi:hypothetical protein
LRAIVKKVKEGKPAVEAADGRFLFAQALIADIAAEVENDRQETLSGLGGDNQTISPTLNTDLKLSKKSAR